MAIGQLELEYVRDLVYRRSAIVLDAGKDYLLESRLAPLARQRGMASIDELVSRARANALDLQKWIVEALTTNETSFFRDIHPFEALRDDVFPRLMEARRSTRRLHVWCAAASTGQEPFTIAMTAREHFPELATWDFKIVGTDLCEAVLERAREGLYRQLEVNRGLPATMLVKYFDRRGADWQIKPELRRIVEFKKLNLIEPWPPLGAPDVVFIRNVLIYFDVATKRGILEKLRNTMAPDGALFLGGAETTMNLDDGFERVQAGKAAYYRIKERRKR